MEDDRNDEVIYMGSFIRTTTRAYRFLNTIITIDYYNCIMGPLEGMSRALVHVDQYNARDDLIYLMWSRVYEIDYY